MIQLPSPIAAYVEAANAQDAARVADCFTQDGIVHDEGAVRCGRDDIAAWAHETGARYQFAIAPVGLTGTAEQCQLTADVSGNFPGSPVTLRFHFTVRPEGIVSLEIGA